MTHNFINLTDKQKDKPLFRVFTVNRLFEIFEENKLALVRPKKWDDPFENYMMNATGELETGELFSIGFREHFYGQCWSFTRESDALWRIYAPAKDGVRVASTPRKLLKALYAQGGKFQAINSFIGKVSYLKTKELLEFIGKPGYVQSLILDPSGIGQAQTLLFKRISFKHENEARLIYNSFGKIKSDIFKFKVDPIDLFDDIVFDPRMDYKAFAKYKIRLRELGFKKRIVKSTLYRIPKLKFKLDSRY